MAGRFDRIDAEGKTDEAIGGGRRRNFGRRRIQAEVVGTGSGAAAAVSTRVVAGSGKSGLVVLAARGSNGCRSGSGKDQLPAGLGH